MLAKCITHLIVSFFSFNRCKNLVNVKIDVVYIRRAAFSMCTNLTNVTLTDELAKIESNCFNGCNSLTNITFLGTIDSWNSITKDTDWNTYIPATHVHCSDGDVAL